MHLFCSIEHIAVAEIPHLSGALDQTLMFQVCSAPLLSMAVLEKKIYAYPRQEIQLKASYMINHLWLVH